jgi:hypothetical protein
MKSRMKTILFVLLIGAAVFSVEAQSPNNSTVADDEMVCGLHSDLVNIEVSVWSERAGYIKDLTEKDFIVYEEKTAQSIEFFLFDEQTNRYSIGYYPEIDFSFDQKWRKVEIKVNLSKEKKREYGEVTVSGTNGYYPSLLNQN